MPDYQLDRESFRALASETRVGALKALDSRRKTASELARELKVSVQTVAGHLETLEQAGLVAREPSERKWVYYSLTAKGRSLLRPQENRHVILLGAAALAFAAGAYRFVLGSLFAGSAPSTAPAVSAIPALETSPTVQALAAGAAEAASDAAAQAPRLAKAAATAVQEGGTAAGQAVSQVGFSFSQLELAALALSALFGLAAAYVYFKNRRKH